MFADSIYNRMEIAVSVSDRTLIREARKQLEAKLRNGRHCRDARRAFYRELLECHRMAQNLVERLRI